MEDDIIDGGRSGGGRMGVQRARSDESQCRRENTNKSHSVPCCTRMERGGGDRCRDRRWKGNHWFFRGLYAQPLRFWLGDASRWVVGSVALCVEQEGWGGFGWTPGRERAALAPPDRRRLAPSIHQCARESRADRASSSFPYGDARTSIVSILDARGEQPPKEKTTSAIYSPKQKKGQTTFFNFPAEKNQIWTAADRFIFSPFVIGHQCSRVGLSPFREQATTCAALSECFVPCVCVRVLLCWEKEKNFRIFFFFSPGRCYCLSGAEQWECKCVVLRVVAKQRAARMSRTVGQSRQRWYIYSSATHKVPRRPRGGKQGRQPPKQKKKQKRAKETKKKSKKKKIFSVTKRTSQQPHIVSPEGLELTENGLRHVGRGEGGRCPFQTHREEPQRRWHPSGQGYQTTAPRYNPFSPFISLVCIF